MPSLFILRRTHRQSFYWGTADLTFWFYLLFWCNTFTVLVFCIIYVKKKKTFLFTEYIYDIDVFICGICGF